MAAILRKYGVTTTILFPLIDGGGRDFESTPVTMAAGDFQISKDEEAFANTSTTTATHEGNGIYSLALTATEMEAERIVITAIDQTATKLWEDQAILVETYGDASAQHAFDLNLAALTEAEINAQADLALADVNLDKLIQESSTVDDSLGAPTSTIFYTDQTEPTDDHFLGMIIAFTSGALLGQARRISDYAGSGSNGYIVVATAFTEAPADGDTFIIIPVPIFDVAVGAGGIKATSIETAAINQAKLDSGTITAIKIAAGALTAAKFAVDTDVYQAKVWLIDDDGSGNDRYVVAWYKNGTFLPSGVSNITIWVFTTGAADLVGTDGSPQAMAEIASTHVFKYDEGSNRITDGVAYVVRAQATIESETRTWMQPVGRDS